ncbi:MAG: hypothetical protein ACREJN_16810 [Nitrospiraceae bacterium]
MPINRNESKRVKALRQALHKCIPKFPNNRVTLKSLEEQSLESILIHYMNWAVRYVSIRPRAVHIESTASSDARWPVLKVELTTFLSKAKSGEDLTPHLSLEPHTRGYTPASSGKGMSVDRWADKDYLLNVMGYHHFHLGLTTEPKGFVCRTDDLVFAKVTRDQFNVIAIFDHSVFDMSRSPTGDMTKERDRLWRVFDEFSARGLPPGSVYIPAMITTSGHSLDLVRRANDYASVIQEIDPKLDDISFIRDMYQLTNEPCPPKPKLAWDLNLLDLGLIDSSRDRFFIFRYGQN